MNEITVLVDWVRDIGLVGILITLAVPSMRKRIWGYAPDISSARDEVRNEIQSLSHELRRHLKEEGAEVKEIRRDIASIEADISFIKGKLEK